MDTRIFIGFAAFGRPVGGEQIAAGDRAVVSVVDDRGRIVGTIDAVRIERTTTFGLSESGASGASDSRLVAWHVPGADAFMIGAGNESATGGAYVLQAEDLREAHEKLSAAGFEILPQIIDFHTLHPVGSSWHEQAMVSVVDYGFNVIGRVRIAKPSGDRDTRKVRGWERSSPLAGRFGYEGPSVQAHFFDPPRMKGAPLTASEDPQAAVKRIVLRAKTIGEAASLLFYAGYRSLSPIEMAPARQAGEARGHEPQAERREGRASGRDQDHLRSPVMDFKAEAARLSIPLGPAPTDEEALARLRVVAADASDIFASTSAAMDYLTTKPLDGKGRNGLRILREKGLPGVLSGLDHLRFGYRG